MTEGFLLHVKADDGAVGLLLVLQFEQRSQKAVNRVGGQSLVVGQLSDAVERAVQYAVASITMIFMCIFLAHLYIIYSIPQWLLNVKFNVKFLCHWWYTPFNHL